MDALLMCGGRGSRLDAETEKPLFEVGGRPMVDRVADALADSRVEAVRAVVSPHTPRTRDHLDLPVIDAPGEGYVADLGYALEQVDRPVLTVVADLPLLDGTTVDRVLEAHADASLTACVPTALKELLGASVGTTTVIDGREVAPSGLNVVSPGDSEAMYVTYDARLAVNVNRQSDARVAEALL